jgi:hypothetical protein
MEFIKKNYEKVILSVVLLGLAVAAALLPFRVSSERARLDEIENMDVREQKRILKPLDLSTNEALQRELSRPLALNLTKGHNLFNPVQWQRLPDGNLRKIVTGREYGPGALPVTDVRPLKLIVAFDGASSLGNETAYRFKVVREADRNPRNRAPVTRQVSAVGSKNDLFILRDMQPRENPAEFVLEMVANKQTLTVKTNEAYEGVAGYMADLRYEPDKKDFLAKRIDDRLAFASDTNKIVAITTAGVTVEAVSNKKRTTIDFKAPSTGAPR